MPAERIASVSLILTTLLCCGIALLFQCFEPRKSAGEDGLSYADLRLRGLGSRRGEAFYLRALRLFCGALFAFALFKTLKSGDVSFALIGALASFYVYWLLQPREYIFGSVRSLFSLAADLLGTFRRKRLDRDLYTCCVVLKNLAIVQKSSPLSADVMLEKLAKCASRELKPIFWSMLSMYRTGKGEQAFRYFAAAVGTPAGRTAAGIFSKLDRINPAELLEQTEALIDAMKERRVTQGHIQAQRNGVITMALATATIMIAMLDFLVVVVYMDLMLMLSQAW